MMKPGIGTYERFKEMFEQFSKEAGKKQHLIPYFIAAHPGTTDEDMVNLALWLKANNFQLDQVQTFMPTPMAMATTMYHSGKNPLRKVSARSEAVDTRAVGPPAPPPQGPPALPRPGGLAPDPRGARAMGRGDLIGASPRHLVPRDQPVVLDRRAPASRRRARRASRAASSPARWGRAGGRRPSAPARRAGVPDRPGPRPTLAVSLRPHVGAGGRQPCAVECHVCDFVTNGNALVLLGSMSC